MLLAGTLSAGEFRDIQCHNVHVGRFAAIHFDHPGTLTVCEFEVFGGKFPSRCLPDDLMNSNETYANSCLYNKTLYLF